MKYLILPKDSERIIHISDTLDYQENGNYLINDGHMAIPPSICNLVEVENVPAEVVTEQYCYNPTNGFYLNPDWSEPIDPIDKMLNELEAQLNV